MIRNAAEDLGPALCAKEFWLMAFTIMLGFTQQDPWVILPIAVLLTLWSCVSVRQWVDKFRAVAAARALAGYWLLCLALNVLFIGGAFVLGAGVRWLFV